MNLKQDSPLDQLFRSALCVAWLTAKSFVDRSSRPALEVRANGTKSFKEGCKRLSTRLNGFDAINPDFNHGRVSNEASSLAGLLSVNEIRLAIRIALSAFSFQLSAYVC